MTQEDIKELWGEDLYSVFANHINQEGWLTEDWSDIIENEIPKFDKDYNDNPLFKETYERMYNLDYIESECGNFIKPT